MAKELPYFKFEAAKWITGKITLEDDSVQGLFTNICAQYWFKTGKLTLSEIKRRLFKSKPDDFEALINGQFLKIENDEISIDFLDEQLEERLSISDKNAQNGRLGGRPKLKKPTALLKISDTKAKKSNIEEKRREEKREIQLPDSFYPSFNDFWNLYGKKVGRPKSERKWISLDQSEKEKVMLHVPGYVKSTPDIKYRKDPTTYLNNESWNDQIITSTKSAVREVDYKLGNHLKRS